MTKFLQIKNNSKTSISLYTFREFLVFDHYQVGFCWKMAEFWTGTDFCYFFVSGAECNTFFVRLYFFFNLNYNWHIVDHLSVHSFLLCRGIQNAFSLTVAQKFVKASISHLKDYLEFKTTIFYVSHHQKIRQMKVFLQSFQKNSWNHKWLFSISPMDSFSFFISSLLLFYLLQKDLCTQNLPIHFT